MYFGFLSIPRVASLGLIEGHRVIGDDRGIRTDSAEFSHPRLRCICRVRSTRATLKRRRGNIAKQAIASTPAERCTPTRRAWAGNVATP
jgi:hypothetical protein